MAKPIIKTIQAYDARQAKTIEFVYSGNMAYNNTMVIYDAETQRKVYDDTYPTEHWRLDHVIPGGILQNDHKYAVTVQVIDMNGQASAVSDKYYFWTISAPTFKLLDLDPDIDNKVYNSSLTLNVQYTQDFLETLSWIKFHLYNDHKQPLQETNEDYTRKLTYTFKALENNATYFVRATGFTTRGLTLDTGYVKISIHYQNPTAYTRVQAEVDERTGFVNYSSNLVVISPTRNNYNYSEGHIDLTTVDLKKQISISAQSTLMPSMDVHWNNTQGAFNIEEIKRAAEGVVISNYRTVKKIIIYGASQQEQIKQPGDFAEINNITVCDMYINGELFPNVNDGFRMSKLATCSDSLIIENDGSRKLIRRVGNYTFTITDSAVKTEKYADKFVTYYALGGLKGVSEYNVMCTCLPVMSDNRTHISIDPITGYIKIVWLEDTGVIDEDDARAFFGNNEVTIQYPLALPEIHILNSLIMPSEIDNHNYVRYDNNFVLPENATFKMKMRNCRRDGKFLRVMSGEENGFVLSGIVYEDFAFRFKLTVFNNGGSNSIQYSKALTIDHNDTVNIVIRRVNGLYALYVQSIEDSSDEDNGLWIGVQQPTEAEVREIWLDLDRDFTHVTKDEMQRFYSAHKPAGMTNFNIWIGEDDIE